MKQIILADQTDFNGWRDAARGLIAANIAPPDVTWSVGQANDLFGEGTLPKADGSLAVPRAFIVLAQSVILSNDPARFSVLYNLLWRIARGEKHLLNIATDRTVHRATMLAKSVRRDIHKMRAFLRFTEVPGADASKYYAWFEPDHFIVSANAGFFQTAFCVNALVYSDALLFAAMGWKDFVRGWRR